VMVVKCDLVRVVVGRLAELLEADGRCGLIGRGDGAWGS
jgi:hypothetical protein